MHILGLFARPSLRSALLAECESQLSVGAYLKEKDRGGTIKDNALSTSGIVKVLVL